MNRKKIVVIIAVSTVGLLFVVVSLFGIYTFRNKNLALRVNGVGVPKSLYIEQSAQLAKFYSQSNQKISDDALRDTVLSNLTDNQLISNYAKKNGITVSTQAIESYYNQRKAGYENEQAFLNKINDLYGMNKEQYIQSIRNDLLREAVQAKVNQPLTAWLSEARKNAKITIYIKK